jgi:type IV pilus assembly protein PilM
VYWAIQREERFLEKETVVDFQVEEGGEVNASPNLNITGVLAERQDIEDLQHAFSQAGYSLAGIGLPLFALRNLVSLRSEANQTIPAMVCHMGQHATSVSVLLEGRLIFTRNIPLGLNNLSETLVKELDPTPSPEEAGSLILKLGVENEELSSEERQQQERAFDLLRPPLERTVRQIERTLQYFQSNFNAEPIETIYIGGEIAGRGYLFDYFSEHLPTNVIAIDPFDTPGLKANASLPASNAARIAYGPAFGLALEGSHTGANLAYSYQDRQVERKHRTIAAAVSIFLLLLTAAAGLFYSQKRSELSTLHSERDKLSQTLKSLGPPLNEAVIKQETEEVRALQLQRKTAAERYEGLALLSEITRLTPENISLLHVSALMGGFIENLKKMSLHSF